MQLLSQQHLPLSATSFSDYPTLFCFLFSNMVFIFEVVNSPCKNVQTSFYFMHRLCFVLFFYALDINEFSFFGNIQMIKTLGGITKKNNILCTAVFHKTNENSTMYYSKTVSVTDYSHKDRKKRTVFCSHIYSVGWKNKHTILLFQNRLLSN